MIYYAHAKINLRLEVEKCLKNDFHYLHMVNAKIGLADALHIEESDKNEVTYSVNELNRMEKNTCLLVLEQVSRMYKLDKKFKIYIEKKIPIGAGLGGGTADAAAIINFLNEYNNLNMSYFDKLQIGLHYGTDIPYCLCDDIAYVEGIGDIVTPVNCELSSKVIIVYPNINVSTKLVYNNLKKYSQPLGVKKVREYIENKKIKELLHNDLESSAFEIFPILKQIKTTLASYGDVVMSGSGSAFIIFPKTNDSFNQIRECYKDFLVVETEII